MGRTQASPKHVDPPITPPPVPRGVDTVVVYGGVFDPPHYYHALGPLSVTHRLFGERGWLLYVPAAQSPLKPAGPVASDSQRIAMLRLALDIPGRRSIWTDEIDRAKWQRKHGGQKPSYTVDTLRRLKTTLPRGVRLRLLIGADQAADFHKWKNPREVIRLAEPLVMAREPVSTVSQLFHSLDVEFWTREERAAWCRCMAPNFPMPGASTSIRDRIPSAPRNPSKWADDDDLSLVVTPVAAYIVKHKLYGFGARRAKGAQGGLKGDDKVMAEAMGHVVRGALSQVDTSVYPRKAATRLRGAAKRRSAQ